MTFFIVTGSARELPESIPQATGWVSDPSINGTGFMKYVIQNDELQGFERV
jgi:hypothetical protein